MNWKKYISVILILMLLLICVSACQTGNPPETEGRNLPQNRLNLRLKQR